MTRRTFLRLALAAALTLIPKRGHANMTTLNGYCANDFTQANALALAPAVMRVSFGQWLLTHNDFGGAKVWLDVTGGGEYPFFLNTANLQAVKSKPFYDARFFIHNEPDLNMSPQDAVNIALAQMDIILSAEPNPYIILAAGTHVHPWYLSNSWFDQMWNLFPRGVQSNGINYRSFIKAFHIHCYQPMGLIEFLRESNAYRLARFPEKEIVLGEIGRPLGSTYSQYAPANIQGRCNAHNIKAWMWYAEFPNAGTDATNYNCLYDANHNLTPDGQEFAGLN